MFEHYCNNYPHYLGAVIGHFNGDTKLLKDTHLDCYTSIDGEIFVPRGYYLEDNTTPVVFDSGCTVVVTPHLSDFIRSST